MARTWGDFEIDLGRKLVRWLRWLWTLQFVVSFYYEKMPATVRPHNRPCTKAKNNNAATHWGLKASSRFAGASRDPQGPCGLHVPMAQLVPRSALLLAKISAGMPIAAVASTALDARNVLHYDSTV
jgi:hypothetical protein